MGSVVQRVEEYDVQASPYHLRPMPTNANMDPGWGFWVYATSAASWTVTN